jgi:ABC-type multidrug transport system fused ATPase/permease subunit
MSKKFHNIGELFADYRAIIAKRPRLLTAAIVLSLAAAVAEGIGLSVVYPILDSVLNTHPDQGLVWRTLRSVASVISNSVVEGLLVLAVGVFAIKALLLIFSNLVMSVWVYRLQEDWCMSSLAHYLYGPYSGVVQERKGQILQNALNEPLTAAKGVETLLSLLVKSIFAVVLIGTLLILNWKLTLGLLIVVAAVTVIVRPYLYMPMEKLGRKRMTSKQTMQAVAAEPLFAASTIKLLGAEATVLQRMKHPLRKFTRASVLSNVFSKAPDDLVEVVIIAAVAVTFIVLARVLGMSFQDVAPLIGAFALVSQRLLSTLSGLMGKRLNIASVAASLLLVQRLVADEKHDRALYGGSHLDRIDGDIEYRNVDFSYPNGNEVLKGLSLTFPKGKVIGIVGVTGVGKSTIGHLLVRLFEPTGGSVLVDGRDIQEFPLHSLRRRSGYVEQNPAVFNGTIAENILLGNPLASREDVVDAANAAGLRDFIASLANGIDTEVSDQGTSLSGGERQRVAIARAIVRKPDLFVFDEGTSALDSKTELLVQESIQRLSGNVTVILIAHRISTLKDADLIYEILPDGKAVVRSFEELAA